jgi:hypothetical protein
MEVGVGGGDLCTVKRSLYSMNRGLTKSRIVYLAAKCIGANPPLFTASIQGIKLEFHQEFVTSFVHTYCILYVRQIAIPTD